MIRRRKSHCEPPNEVWQSQQVQRALLLSPEIATSCFALLAMTVLFLCFFQPFFALADHQDPIAQTNVNQQTDLFQKSVGDVKGFEEQIEGEKKEAVGGLKNSGNTIFEISGKRESQIQNEIGSLKNITANDLGDRGAKEASESGIMDEIYIDENQPLYTEHQKDAQAIANGTKDLLGNLLVELKEVGVDCKQVKGNKEIEPEYHIDIEKEENQDARYDQLTCEELRNNYSCRDELSLRCVRQGIRWGSVENRYLETTRQEIDQLGFAGIYWSDKVAKNICEIKLRSLYESNFSFFKIYHNHNKNYEVELNNKNFLARKLGVSVENIVEVTANGHKGGVYKNGIGKEYNWYNYYFNYRYREGYRVCEQWQEEWNEECKL